MTLIFTQSDREATSASIRWARRAFITDTFLSAFDCPPPLPTTTTHMLFECIQNPFPQFEAAVEENAHSLMIHHPTVSHACTMHFVVPSLHRLWGHGARGQRRLSLAERTRAACARLYTLTLVDISKEVIFVAPAQIKMCYNNPIWDGLDSRSESTHIMTR